ARGAGMPVARNGTMSSLDTTEAMRRLRSRPLEPAPDARLRRLRVPLQRALVRLGRSQATHQRLVDEELVRLLRTLDERVEGIAVAQASLAAELTEIKRRVEQ
ncbi:MAG: hypothetical protein M3350_09800, partial [Actinomycetota bacterium]|nr:hypothetical protein [Actinomycetota bacterium]